MICVCYGAKAKFRCLALGVDLALQVSRDLLPIHKPIALFAALRQFGRSNYVEHDLPIKRGFRVRLDCLDGGGDMLTVAFNLDNFVYGWNTHKGLTRKR